MKVTIKDVAKAAGVSIATVSRVINNAENVTPKIREHVEKVIAELNYQPNFMARSLKNNETRTIGAIVSDISISFFINILKEIEDQLKEFGYILIVASTDDDPLKEHQYLKMMAEKRVDGIVISSTGKNEEQLNNIRKAGIPVVMIDRRPQQYEFDTVYMDKFKATYDITKYLIENGHKRIALISGPRELSTNYDRFSGFTKALYEYGIPNHNGLCYFGQYSARYGRNTFRDILDMDERPTAIISGSEIITSGILLEAKKLQIKIPDEFSIVSYGNIPLGDLYDPSITYIDDEKEKIGEVAGEMLVNKLINNEVDIISVVVESKIVFNNSVKCIK